MAHASRFAEALAAHEAARLRTAFEVCSRSDDRGYDRTSLNRWMDGTIPTRGDFIRRLADELDDPALYEAWQEARDERSTSPARSVVSRFEGLTTEEKDWVFHEIRGDYVSTFPSVRSRLTYRIEIDDPDRPDADEHEDEDEDEDDHLQVRVTNTWTGAVPARATVRFVTAQPALGDAYADPACIFREELAFEPDRLQRLLAGSEDQVLAINPLDSRDPRGVHHVGEQTEPGLFRFGNDEATLAQVRVSMTYPYPRGRPIFFVKFGRYQVPDTAELTLTLRSRTAFDPRAFPYMPPGRQREWASSQVHPNELFVSLGTGNTVLSEGDGVVLYWTDR